MVQVFADDNGLSENIILCKRTLIVPEGYGHFPVWPSTCPVASVFSEKAEL